MPRETGYSPEDISKLEEQRGASDAEKVRGGAVHKKDKFFGLLGKKRLAFTADQVEAAREEMEQDEGQIRKKREEKTRCSIIRHTLEKVIFIMARDKIREHVPFGSEDFISDQDIRNAGLRKLSFDEAHDADALRRWGEDPAVQRLLKLGEKKQDESRLRNIIDEINEMRRSGRPIFRSGMTLHDQDLEHIDMSRRLKELEREAQSLREKYREG